jgi:hypothetical protein
MKRRLRAPSPAFVVALIALFVALGGTTYAATSLPKNSVGSAQLKKGAVTKAKINKKALKQLKGNRGPAGAAGTPGEKGDTGPPGPLVDTLPTGKTLRGSYSFGGVSAASGYHPVETLTYQFPLTSSPTINIIDVSGAATTACPGSATNPQATAGNLCVYQSRNDGGLTFQVTDANRFGAAFYFPIATSTSYEFEGTWAVTGN